MKKKIAVIVRERQAEALRMGLGLTILNDEIEIYLMKRLEDAMGSSPDLSLMRELGMKIYTIFKENSDFEVLSQEEMARRLLEYDAVLAY